MMISELACAVSVQLHDFDVGHEIRCLNEGRCDIGAVVSFVGYVRDFSSNQGITALELEHYPGMTERSLNDIARRAMMRWPLIALRVIHRYGKLSPSDQIVLVVTASAHRHDAYEANAFVMDYLKTQAPFWKKEYFQDVGHWVQARESDLLAASRWA